MSITVSGSITTEVASMAGKYVHFLPQGPLPFQNIYHFVSVMQYCSSSFFFSQSTFFFRFWYLLQYIGQLTSSILLLPFFPPLLSFIRVQKNNLSFNWHLL